MSNDNTPKQRSYRDVDVSDQEWGSDLIADLLKAYGFEYVSYNPGASFRGIEESLVNYNDNCPETVTVANEGLAVSIAHGYAKATCEPSLCFLHDTVGTLNGSMSIYNAYVDRAPILIVSGNGPLRKSKRRPWIEWIHSHLNQGGLVRDFVKWFDQPAHSDGVVESLIRGHNIAATPRTGPTYVTIDHDLQENTLESPGSIPDLEKLEPPTGPGPDPSAIERAADRLVAAEMPVIVTDQVGDSREAVDALVDLAEALGAPVLDASHYRSVRYNFPNTHPLNATETEIVQEADLLLALDVVDLNSIFVETVDPAAAEFADAIEGDVELIDIGLHDIDASSHIADYFGLQETDVSILSDTAIAIPELVDAVADRLDENSTARRRSEERSEEIARRHREQRDAWEREAEQVWDETPISLPRLTGELWDVIRDDDWVLVNGGLRGWPHRLWEIDEFDQYIGGMSGGGGVGYGIGAAIGGALAYEDTDRIPINLQADGDLMQFPAGLWTMARYDIPVFTVVHNNEALYNSTNHRMNLANYRGRDDSYERALIGTGLTDPLPDYATVAEGFGVTGYGPIKDPNELAPVLQDAWNDVKDGKPVLVDVQCQPR